MIQGSGVFLESLTWPVAEQWLTSDRVVVLPLGAAAKEHGPHLPLNNDAVTANWLARAVCRQLPVVVAPLVNTHFYPAFVEYPGSISLRESTASDLIVDICTSLATYGPHKFYVINTGVSTEGPLATATEQLERSGLTLAFSSLGRIYEKLPADVFSQTHGSHADERETSLMLHIAPEIVDMAGAVCDGTEGDGRLTRTRGIGTYSPSGVYGDATLASKEKGEQLAEVMVAEVCDDIRALISM